MCDRNGTFYTYRCGTFGWCRSFAKHVSQNVRIKRNKIYFNKELNVEILNHRGNKRKNVTHVFVNL